MKTAQIEVCLLDHMGSDLTVVNAARVSFDKTSTMVPVGREVVLDMEPVKYTDWTLSEKDARLVRYLAKHGHWTPFGHCTAQFRIKAPIFVARQLVKHQVGLVWNEVSRRYVDDEPEFWFPETWRARADNVKQGSSETETIEVVKTYEYITGFGPNPFETHPKWILDRVCEEALRSYQELLDAGVAPEQARIVLPQNTMTEWWWTGSLMAFARVCRLRLDPHAQAETREVAEYIAASLHGQFPVSWNALMTTENPNG